MSAQGRLSPGRKRLFALAALLLGSGLVLSLLEIGLRLSPPRWLAQRMIELSPGRPYVTGTDETWPAVRENGRFRQFRPGSSFVARHHEYEHVISIDELGGRVTPYAPPADDLLPFLGDSFTLGLGVDDQETFLARIGADAGRRLLNLGVSGSGLHDHLNIIEMRHEELGSPSFYVFVLFTGNDLSDIRARHEPSNRERGWLWRMNTFVTKNPRLSRLYSLQLLRQPLLKTMNRASGGQMPPVFLSMRTDTDYLQDSLAFLKTELERLVAVSDELGFEHLSVLIPDVHQLDDRRRQDKAASLGLNADTLDPDRLTRAISNALRDFRISYVDLGPCLGEGRAADLFYIQDTHLTAAGHARAAECILRNELLRSLLSGHDLDDSLADSPS